jgi:hypothetical protein
VKTRALDLAVVQRAQLAALGPAARALSVSAAGAGTLIRIATITDDALRDLAENLGLGQVRTERCGRIWWRQVSAMEDGVLVVAAGPYYDSTLAALGSGRFR